MTSLTTAPADFDGPCSRVSNNDARVQGPCSRFISSTIVNRDQCFACYMQILLTSSLAVSVKDMHRFVSLANDLTHLGRCSCFVPADSRHDRYSSSCHTCQRTPVNILRCWTYIRLSDHNFWYLTEYFTQTAALADELSSNKIVINIDGNEKTSAPQVFRFLADR